MNKNRPKYLDLFAIRLPLPGFVSILHRISGFGLFVFLPLLLWLLDNSLHSRSSFTRFQEVTAQPMVKLILVGLAWAFLHHMCAGLRCIALDLDRGTELPAARASSKVVLGVSLVLTLIIGATVW